MVRVDAQGKQQGIVRDLHDPRRGESIAFLAVGYADRVNALRKALKKGRHGWCTSLGHCAVSQGFHIDPPRHTSAGQGPKVYPKRRPERLLFELNSKALERAQPPESPRLPQLELGPSVTPSFPGDGD